MRCSSRSCGSTLRILRLYLKVAIFQPELQEHAPRTTFVLKSCDFQAGAAADQAGTEPAPAGLRKQARKPRDNFQRPFREQENRTGPQLKTDSHGATATALRHARSPQRVRRGQGRFARGHSDSASTRTISAEGSPRSRQIRTGPQRQRFDTHDLRRGFAAVKTNSHGATARALRHARSPQRVRRGQGKFARRHSDSASTRAILAEGSPRSRQIRTAPQRERFDTHDLRRRFIGLKTDSHGATARAIRHARSPQRVHRAQDRFARDHSDSASTRTISANGSPRSRQIRTGPQRQRFDMRDLRRGLAAVKTNSHGATARALRHARFPQRVHRAQDRFARDHSDSASTRTISAEGSPRSRQIRTAPQRERFDTHDLRRGYVW